MKNAVFYLGLGLLCTHEMDAMTHHEWRVLPLTRAFAEPVAETLFVLAHVPLFAILIALVASLNTRVRARARLGVAIFLVLHAGLHLAFSGHVAYEFQTLLSSVLIYGAAVCGTLFLALEVVFRRKRQKRGEP